MHLDIVFRCSRIVKRDGGIATFDPQRKRR